MTEILLGSDNLLWVGETHGIANNFLAYKQLLQNFQTVALEYPEELEQFTEEKFMKYASYQDGRFSHESLDFFKWLQTTNLRVLCFDVRDAVKSQQEGEDVMAENLMSKLTTDSKALVITGSLHGRRKPVQQVIPQAGLMENAGYKIMPVGLKYAGGQFFNFGLKQQDNKFLDFDDQNLPFGTVTTNTNELVDVKYWFHVGEALPVKLFDGVS